MRLTYLVFIGISILTAPQQSIDPTLTFEPLPGSRATYFQDAVQPLLEDEWWGAVAVKCGLRSPAWLTNLETSIDQQVGKAGRIIWTTDRATSAQHIKQFIGEQTKLRTMAWRSGTARCQPLTGSGKIDELDRMSRMVR